MAAIFTAIFSLLSRKRPKFIALGSLYVDTLRILERWPNNFNLIETSFIREDFTKLLEKTINENISGVIIEVPSNPLIELADFEKLIEISHSKGAKVIIDNTIATPINFNPFNLGADIIVHSTSKILNGKNNHIGGALLSNSEDIIENIKKFNELTKLDMNVFDMRTLLRNLKKFKPRMEIINENSKAIANFLNHHHSVKKVFHPSLENNPNHLLMKKYLKGGSGLLSFILRDPSAEIAGKFYDHIQKPILKGPSLGSEKTLLSPYVMMAHYEDSKEDLKKWGLEFYLMRLSVGIEPVEEIIACLRSALNLLK